MQNISKQLSYVLRHKPESIGITLTKDGYAEVSVILNKLKITMDDLILLVDTNNKKRFAFNNDKTLIRANQGHSINVKIDYKKVIPPTILYHGTPTKNVGSIMKSGLQKMNRHFVHLSKDTQTAQNVGSRRGECIILEIDTKSMLQDGYIFYISDNNVYLIDEVPTKYIKIFDK